MGAARYIVHPICKAGIGICLFSAVHFPEINSGDPTEIPCPVENPLCSFGWNRVRRRRWARRTRHQELKIQDVHPAVPV